MGMWRVRGLALPLASHPALAETAPARTAAVTTTPTLPPRIPPIPNHLLQTFPSRTARDPRVPSHTYGPQLPPTVAPHPAASRFAPPSADARHPLAGRTYPMSRPMPPASAAVQQRGPFTSRLAPSSFPSASPRPNRAVGAAQAPSQGVPPASDNSFRGPHLHLTTPAFFPHLSENGFVP